MSGQYLGSILGGLAHALLVLALAPFLEGVLRKVTALVQSRRGPPLRQPYFDLFKLLGKEDIEVGERPGMQRFAAYLALAAPLTLAAWLPLSGTLPAQEFGDALVLVYLLTLCGIATLLAGLAAGSTYSLLGISREMMTLMTLEPLLAVAMVVGAVHADSLRLDAIFSGAIYGAHGIPWSGLLMLGLLVFSFQAYVKRVPFDVAEAETEIMEGPLVEYSGPKLALFKWAMMVKLVLSSALFVALFLPWGNGWPLPLGLAVFWLKIVLVVLAVTLIAATHARYRIDQAVRYFAGLLGLALVALVLATYGH